MSHQVAFVFASHACQICLLGDICFAYLLQGMIEWEQEHRAAEVDALQLALEEKDGHSVLKQTRVSAVHLFLLDELHLIALSWRVTSRACAVSFTAWCLVSCQVLPLPDPGLTYSRCCTSIDQCCVFLVASHPLIWPSYPSSSTTTKSENLSHMLS